MEEITLTIREFLDFCKYFRPTQNTANYPFDANYNEGKMKIVANKEHLKLFGYERSTAINQSNT